MMTKNKLTLTFDKKQIIEICRLIESEIQSQQERRDVLGGILDKVRRRVAYEEGARFCGLGEQVNDDA